MVYDWSGSKEQECYQLYVEQRKPLDEVMEIMKQKYDFNPSKRAYQVQFKRWQFPSKQHPAHKDAALVERTRQLWEANSTQRDILRTLRAEGFEISDRELMRMRSRNRWLLRAPASMKANAPNIIDSFESPTPRDEAPDNVETEIQNLMMVENANTGGSTGSPEMMSIPENMQKPPAVITPEVQLRKQQRLEQLQAESEERYRTKKRRRRTRGWAGLPADPPAPPRFPSETTLDESKAYLHLTNEMYRELRDTFMNVCLAAGFMRKTEAGSEKWQEAKEKLIASSPHLTSQIYGPHDGVPKESKQLALDVVCMDVTKRMRTMEKRMTLADAKNKLGFNPEEAREVRQNFYDILINDHFTSKHEAGQEHWDTMKSQWINNFPILQHLLLPLDDESKREYRRAADVICRDVMKRLRDDQTKENPTLKKQVNMGPGPGPARPKILRSSYDPTSLPVQAFNTDASRESQDLSASLQTDLQIDPTLLAAASHPALALDQLRQYAASADQEETTSVPTSSQVMSPSHHLPALIRVGPGSTPTPGSKMWVVILSSRNLAELEQLVAQEHPGMKATSIEGVTSNSDGSEALMSVDDDAKLQLYLNHTPQGKVQFQVVFS